MFRLFAIVCIAALVPTAPASEAPPQPPERHFELTYEAALTSIPDDAKVIDFWVPLPRDLPEQTVRIDETRLPEGARIGEDPVHGNKMLHLRWSAPFPDRPGVDLRFEIRRNEVVIPEAKALAALPPAPPSPVLRRHLGPNALVPLEGRLSDIADELALDGAVPMQLGRRVYDYVGNLMTYGKDTPGYGRGDVLWACDSRTGNCTDFHSVFMGLTRTREVPSYFEIGFPLPPDQTEGEIGGYHCWAWFHGGEGADWVPVDASEADKHPEMFDYYFGALTADRVAFTQGRDLTLVPPQQGPPLNFFIYPYVEIDGVPGGEVDKRFTFRDLD